jgi:outer membrane autotransporter protein
MVNFTVVNSPDADSNSVTVTRDSTNNFMPLDLSGGAASSVAVATPASHGTTTVAGISIFYTPTPGYVGSDSFTYTATNVAGTSAPATISITVNPPPPSAPVVTTPVPGSQVGSFPALVGIADANTTIIIADIGGTELFRTFSMPGGQWSVTFPTPLGLGVQTFRITGEDALGTTSTTTVFTAEVVAPPTAPPVSVTVPYGSPGYPIPLASTGGPATAVGIHAAPLHGGLQLNGTVVTYIPDAGYHGPDSFDYVLKGPGGDSAILTAHVTVTAPAGASDKTVTIPPGGIPAPIDLAAGLPGTISASIGAVVPAEAGSARLVSEGGSHFLHFTPSPYFAGTSSVDFTLVGPDGTSSARVIFNHVYDAAFIQGRVEQQVDSFIDTRAGLLSSSISIPGLRNRFGSGPGVINIAPNGNSVALNFASSTGQLAAWNAAGNAAEALAQGAVDTRFNAWIDASATVHLRNGTAGESWGRFALVSLGADYLVTDGLLVGLALHADSMRDDTSNSGLEGSGFMFGPYISTEISDGLFLDAEVYYGKSWNDLTAGLFRGTFETDRLMARLGLEGEWAINDGLTLRPQVSAFYLREKAAAYVIEDGLGAVIAMPGTLTEQFRLAAGGRLEHQTTVGDNLAATPYIGGQLSLILGDARTNLATRLLLGMDLTLPGNVTLGSELAGDLDTTGLAALTARAGSRQVFRQGGHRSFKNGGPDLLQTAARCCKIACRKRGLAVSFAKAQCSSSHSASPVHPPATRLSIACRALSSCPACAQAAAA